MNSSIMDIAFKQANGIFTNRYRLVILLSQIAKKLNSLDEKARVTAEAKEKLLVFIRLLKAIAQGRYKLVSWNAPICILAAIIYFLNPADIIPDFIPMTGLLDDFSILVWTYDSVQTDLDKFLEWEKTNQSD